MHLLLMGLLRLLNNDCDSYFVFEGPMLYFDDYIFSIHSVKVRILVPNLIIKNTIMHIYTPHPLCPCI